MPGLSKIIGTSAMFPQPPDCWVKPIKLYIQLFNNIWGVTEDDRFGARDKAVLYLQVDKNSLVLEPIGVILVLNA